MKRRDTQAYQVGHLGRVEMDLRELFQAEDVREMYDASERVSKSLKRD